MSIGNIGLYRADGRLRGSYVYLLLCSDSGPIYAKVGMTDDPYRRVLALRTGCPVTPRQFLMFEVRSRRRALTVESAIHAGLNRWAAHGEWFKVERQEKGEFNLALAAAITPHRETGWPCEWSRINVASLVKDAHQRMNAARRKRQQFSASRTDFEKHLRWDA